MDPIPPVLARRERLHNRFFTLVEEDIPDRDGRPYTYHAVEAKWDAVIVVPVCDDGTLLIERIYRHPYRRWMHEFPAGGIEPGEDPLAAAARELSEETGWTAGRVEPLISYEAMPGLLRMRLHIVRATGLRPGGEVRLEAAEFIQVERMTVDDAWRLAEVQPASSFLVCGLLAHGNVRSSGRPVVRSS
jgi:ADP-ribose pyrophosphatase